MSNGLQTESLRLAVSQGMRGISVQVPLVSTTALPPVDGGYPTQGQIAAVGMVSLRRSACGLRRTARIGVTTADLTATYTLTLGSVVVAYDASLGSATDAEELAAEWIADIEADPAADALVEVEQDGAAILVTWRSATATTIDATATGSGVLAVEADPEGAVVQVLTRQDPAAAQVPAPNAAPVAAVLRRWKQAAEVTVGPLGWVQTLDVRGQLAVALWAPVVVGVAGDGSGVVIRAPLALVGPSSQPFGGA
jgi:hypothetical protein